jgi:CBS domain-containing protein
MISSLSSSVRQFMSTDVMPIPSDATLVEAARQMRISGAGGLPVQDTEVKIMGIVTERDIIVLPWRKAGTRARDGSVRSRL